MAVRPLQNQTRNLALLLRELQEGETLLVGFDESGRSHGGRVLKDWTESELTRCIRAAGARSVTFYSIQHSALQPHHRDGWR